MIRKPARRAPPPPPPARKAAVTKPTPIQKTVNQQVPDLSGRPIGPTNPLQVNYTQTPAQKRQYEMELARKKAANPNPAPVTRQSREMEMQRAQQMALGKPSSPTPPRPTPTPTPTKPTANFAMKKGGVAKYAKGGKIDGCAQRGKTKGRMV
jgi:hypothetical protein